MCSAPSPSASAWARGPLRREALRCSQGSPSRLDEGQTHFPRCRQHSREGASESSWYCCISCPVGKVRLFSVRSYTAPLVAPVGISGCPRPCLSEPELGYIPSTNLVLCASSQPGGEPCSHSWHLWFFQPRRLVHCQLRSIYLPSVPFVRLPPCLFSVRPL